MLDKFLTFENSIPFLNKSTSWKYSRLRFYNSFFHSIKFEKRHNQKSILSKIFQADFFLHIKKFQFDKLVIVHQRTHFCENTYYCKYADNYIDSNTLVIGYDKKIKKKYKNIISFGFLKFIAVFFSVFFITKSAIELYKINKHVYSKKAIPNKGRYLFFELYKYSISYAFEYIYGILLKFFKIKKVYAVVAYGELIYPSLVASKKLNIEFTEIQHGVINLNHFGYSFHSSQIINEYFPKNIHLWSKYWIDKIRIKDCMNFGFTSPKYCTNIDVKNDDQRILIVGQPHVRNKLLNLAKKLNTEFKSLKVIYRPHPSEFNLSQDESILIDLDDLEISLMKSTYVLGIDSTVLIEANHFGNKTIQLLLADSYDYSGYENIKTFYNEKNIIDYFKINL